MIRTRTINGVKVEPIPSDPVDPKRIAGYKLFPEPYATVFLCAKRRSGKTTTLFEIIKQNVGKNTRVIGFVATHSNDPSWIHIKKWLKDKKIDSEWYHAVKEDRTDYLKGIIDQLQEEADLREEEEARAKEEKKKKKRQILFFDRESDTIEIRAKKPKKIYPEILFVFDDQSQQIRNSPSAIQLFKQNRHFKSKVLVSSQYPNDLRPESRQQLSYVLIWPGFPEEKLMELYRFMDPSIDFDQFLKLYRYATKEPYHFLYCDVAGCTYRKDFNTELSIPGPGDSEEDSEDSEEDSD